MKTETGKVTQTLLYLKLCWNCLHTEEEEEEEEEDTCTFICLLMAYRFICVTSFIPKNSFMFNFSTTDAHICFT